MPPLLRRLVPEAWKRRSLTRNVMLGWVSTVIGAVLSFILIPFVVRTLDKETYGVWTFLNSLALYSNLLYLGLGTAFMKRFSEAVGRDDVPAQERLLGVACAIYLGLGMLCVAIALGLSPFVPDMFATPLSAATARAASLTMALLGLRLLFTFLGTAFTALLASHGRWDIVTGAFVLVGITRTAVVAWTMTRPNPLIAMAVWMVIEAALQLPLFAWLCRLVAPAVRLRPAMPTRDELRVLYSFGFQAFFVQMSLLLIAYTDTALIAALLGAASVTLYSLPLQLIDYSRVFVTGLTQNLLPELAALRARGETARLRALFLRASRTCGALAVFINVHLVILGPAFLAIWVGPTFTEQAFQILLFLALAATAGAISTQVLIPFYQALDVVRVLMLIVVAEALVNIVLSIWFAQTIGLWGVALATALPALGITMVLGPKYMLPRVGVSAGEFVRHVVAPSLTLAAVCVLTQGVVSIWIGSSSYLLLAVRVACSVATAVPVVALTFPRDEWLPAVARLSPALATRFRG